MKKKLINKYERSLGEFNIIYNCCYLRYAELIIFIILSGKFYEDYYIKLWVRF